MRAVEVGVAVRREHEQPHRRRGAQHVAEQQQRRLVGPVHVVEHEDHRVGLRHLGEEVAHSFEEPVAFGLRIGRHRRGQPGNARREIGQHARQLAAERAELCAQSLHGHTRRVVTQRFGERLERRAELLVAATPQDRRAGLVRVAHELADETRLADAGLARHQHRAPRAFERLLPREEQRLERFTAPREREAGRHVDEGRQRDERGVVGNAPVDVAHRDRRGQSLELARAERVHRELATGSGQHAHEIAHEDLATGRGVAQP